MDFLRKIKVFGGEHAESAIGVSNSLEAFRELVELILRVYLSMENKFHVFCFIKVFGGEHADSAIGVEQTIA